MAIKETTDRGLSLSRRYPDLFSYQFLFNVMGWGLLLLLTWRMVIPAITKGTWEPFSHWVTWRFLLDGLRITVQVALYSIVFSMILGVLLALGRLSNSKFISVPSVIYIELVRALPSYLIIFYVYIGLPKLGVKLDTIWFAIIGLTIYTSTVLAEVVRAGILSVEAGQLEAAYSLGLSSIHTLAHIVLPQAMRRMAPAIVSQLITLTKDTSLGYIIALQELTRKGQQLFQFNGTILETMLVVGAIYFGICYILSLISSKLEARGSVS
jgi:His/Glu/Gln/Arg/opine family amino acid ABC transporter permease subunit